MVHQDFLKIAKELGEANSEAEWRTALGRIYYFAYHECQWLNAVLGDHDGMRLAQGSHQKLSFKFKNYPEDDPPEPLDSGVISDIRMIGYKMIALHASRVRADYKMGVKVNKSDVTQALIEVERLVKRLDSIRHSLEERNPELVSGSEH